MQLGFPRKVGESVFFSVILWSVKPISAFRLSLLKIINWLLYLGNKSSEFVDSLSANSCHLLIIGDFNIHWDYQKNANTKNWLRFLDLTILVSRCKKEDNEMVTSEILSSHVMLTNWSRVCLYLPCCLIISLLPSMYLYRNNLFQLKLFHTENTSRLTRMFFLAVRVSSQVVVQPDDADHLMDFYNNTLRDIVDEYAPLRTKEVPRRPMLPWYNKNIQAAKRHRKYCERLWKRTGLCLHYEMFKISKIEIQIPLPLLN